MNPADKIVIIPGEEFPHLPRAPIVEAVIDVRAHATGAFEVDAVRSILEPRLPGFSFLDSQRQFEHELKIEGEKPPGQCFRDSGWKGVRFRSDDQKKIVQFNRDGFVYSRLEPYPDWNSFSDEGLRLWGVFTDLAQPVEINRAGLRFINRIELPSENPRLGEYIKRGPEPPQNLDLPFLGFMHHETLAVPEYPYAINVIQTIQPPQGETGKGVGLILDIDVFTIQPLVLDEGELARTLEEMRWLKNKVFFGTITEKALRGFQ